MYRILITREIKKESAIYLKKLPAEEIKNSLRKMQNTLNPVDSVKNLDDYKNYLADIIKCYPLIQIMPPSYFNKFIQKHPNISKLQDVDLKKKFHSTGKSIKSFSDMIISRMRYGKKEMMQSIIPFFEKYKFKTCVYCNQFPITYYSHQTMKKKTGTLDHFFNKDRYPFLCTSFFNLFPCCPDCNGNDMKGERKIGFYPYRESTNIKDSPFKFEFNIRAMGKFCSENDVDIDFQEESGMGDVIAYCGNHVLQDYKTIFKIIERYHDYRYMVSDVIRDETFQSIWQNNTASAVSNNRLMPDPDRVSRILRVYSLKNEDIYKRLYMKLLLDLGRKLNLIP